MNVYESEGGDSGTHLRHLSKFGLVQEPALFWQERTQVHPHVCYRRTHVRELAIGHGTTCEQYKVDGRFRSRE